MSDQEQGPEPGLDLTPEEEEVAEAVGAEPLMLELPPQISKGLVLYELEDGSFGFRPVSEGMTLNDVLSLCTKALDGARADLVAAKVIEHMEKRQAAIAKAQQKKRIVLPGRR